LVNRRVYNRGESGDPHSALKAREKLGGGSEPRNKPYRPFSNRVSDKRTPDRQGEIGNYRKGGEFEFKQTSSAKDRRPIKVHPYKHFSIHLDSREGAKNCPLEKRLTAVVAKGDIHLL